MSLFKYFRSGIYLEKTLRYNELYFSANHELNDPNDLVSFYEFEDDESLWYRLLDLPKISEFWEIRHLYCSEKVFVPALNSFFKGRRISSDFFSLQEFFKEINSELDEVLIPFLNERFNKEAKEGETLEHRLSLFKLGLKELLARSVNMKFFSVSFSEDALNPMMWAHYADGFKGCVIIYKAESDIIKLTENLYSNSYTPTKILNVSYNNADKFIPLLKCADAEDKYITIQDKLLIKNEFWSYENEKRAFVISEQKSLFIAQMPKEKYKDDPREKIYHHLPGEILGVIFGPNFDTAKKDKIEYILRRNRHFCRAGDFFIFETKLSRSGEIIIHEGRKCIVTNPIDNSLGTMSQIFKDEHLEVLKMQIGIKKHTNNKHML
ncbi:DUF2971 domain-containing protein [Enterobacter sp. M4-VN]|uniref:DUF2971 domain-containing protein n=1 Tax=Enterobacter sp. M4-VN TaxID=2724127 RepID=UPI0014847FCF|nr:DUF2971 domain-containing protein [Enterobacter sp. M4-VN]GFM09381.1 hypothetical protein NCT2013_17990 [Enterobacter sp. M4-VN]HCM9506492.1 DUF2971 domain-containing protein [Enterobacter kobei]HCM9509612.1 DUF2971 domain-containing protein [Enterobacter kobei]